MYARARHMLLRTTISSIVFDAAVGYDNSAGVKSINRYVDGLWGIVAVAWHKLPFDTRPGKTTDGHLYKRLELTQKIRLECPVRSLAHARATQKMSKKISLCSGRVCSTSAT